MKLQRNRGIQMRLLNNVKCLAGGTTLLERHGTNAAALLRIVTQGDFLPNEANEAICVWKKRQQSHENNPFHFCPTEQIIGIIAFFHGEHIRGTTVLTVKMCHRNFLTSVSGANLDACVQPSTIHGGLTSLVTGGARV